jgi:hypothetical protein
MQTPGVFELGDIAITTAGTQTGTAVTDLDGMLSAAWLQVATRVRRWRHER